MQMLLSGEELFEYIGKQLKLIIPDGMEYWNKQNVKWGLSESLLRCENCFKYVNRSAYSNNAGQSFFKHTHLDQYTVFLYFLANSIWRKTQNNIVCDHLVLLSRVLSSCWISYKVNLPDIFYLEHPVGSVLGHATYSDYLVVSQNVTVNSGTEQGIDGKQLPALGKGLYMAAGSSIIGNQKVGDRVNIGINTVSYKKDIPNDSNLCLINGINEIKRREIKDCVAQTCFNVKI